mgnify:CR=1 FL=1
MKAHIRTIIGAALMAACGAAIGHRIGFVGIYQAYMAGFAVGLLMLSRGPSHALAKRVKELEAQLSLLSETAK